MPDKAKLYLITITGSETFVIKAYSQGAAEIEAERYWRSARHRLDGMITDVSEEEDPSMWPADLDADLTGADLFDLMDGGA